MVQSISLILKLALSLLFGVLLVFEYFDGVHDISDWAVFFFFILMANDAYIHLKNKKGKTFKEWVLSPRIAGKKLIIMNSIFFLMLMGSIVLEFLIVFNLQTKDALYQAMLITWSGIFLAVNLYKLKEAFNFKRLFVTNVALMILIGSFVIF